MCREKDVEMSTRIKGWKRCGVVCSEVIPGREWYVQRRGANSSVTVANRNIFGRGLGQAIIGFACIPLKILIFPRLSLFSQGMDVAYSGVLKEGLTFYGDIRLKKKKTFFQHGTLLRIEYLENLCACRPTCPKKCGTGCNSCERTERKSKCKVVLKESFVRGNCGRLRTVRAIDRRDRSLEISSEVIFTNEWGRGNEDQTERLTVKGALTTSVAGCTDIRKSKKKRTANVL